MRNLVCLFLILVSLSSNAQIEKGTILSGLRMSYSQEKSENEFSKFGGFIASEFNFTSFSISKDVSVLISDQSAIGFGLIYSSTFRETVFDDDAVPSSLTSEEKINTLGFAGFYEHYITLGDKLFLSPRFQILYGFGKTEGTGGLGYETKTSLISISVLPKINYFISSRWNLNLGIGAIGFSRSTEKPVSDNLVADQQNTQNNLSASVGAETLTLGVGYKFK